MQRRARAHTPHTQASAHAYTHTTHALARTARTAHTDSLALILYQQAPPRLLHEKRTRRTHNAAVLLPRTLARTQSSRSLRSLSLVSLFFLFFSFYFPYLSVNVYFFGFFSNVFFGFFTPRFHRRQRDSIYYCRDKTRRRLVVPRRTHRIEFSPCFII